MALFFSYSLGVNQKSKEDHYMYPTQDFNEVALTLYRKLPSVTSYSCILQYFLLRPSLRKYYIITSFFIKHHKMIDFFPPKTLYLSASCIKCPLFSDCAICQLLINNYYNCRSREAANCFHTSSSSNQIFQDVIDTV